MSGKRIVLFGGAFDPPHNTHVAIIRALLKANIADEVWVIPSGERRDKASEASAEDRRKMLELILAHELDHTPRVRLETCALDGLIPGSHTIDLLDYLRAEYPNFKFLHIIGSELIKQLPKWKDYARLEQELEFIVLERKTHEPHTPLPKHVRLLNLSDWIPNDISSSEIRARLKAGLDVSGLIPRSVADYISAQKLYRV